MTGFFILRDEDRRQSALAYIRSLNLNGRTLEVRVKPYKKNRTTAQNSLYWMWLGVLADDLGYTEDDLHELFKARFLGVEEKQIWGDTVYVARSTTRLTTQQFTEYLEKIEALALQMNITLPHPIDLYDEVFTMGRGERSPSAPRPATN